MSFFLCDLCDLLRQFIFGCGWPRRIFDTVFPSLFSQFAPVQILWLRLAAPGFMRRFAAISLSSILRTPMSYQDIAKTRIFPLRI
jgi:hypothetical protein